MQELININEKNNTIYLPLTSSAANSTLTHVSNETSSFSTQQQDNQESLFMVLNRLSMEEATLKEEKSKIAASKQQMLGKITEQIEFRRRYVEHLKTEIADVKAQCQRLVGIVNSNVNSHQSLG